MRRPSKRAIFLLMAYFGAAFVVMAQEPEPSDLPPLPVSQGVPANAQAFSADQLDNLVSPIALYPDPLLGQILVASTYPLEVVEANQWMQRNRNLRGQALINAAKQQPWDPSIQALVAVPDALAKLNQDIRWTTDLGNAFLAQQPEVMSAVQRMRSRAQDNGRLYSTQQQVVRTQEQDGQQVIVIQPASPQVIYVPAYDPFYVWGPPVYGYYPPLFYPSYGYGFGVGFDLGFCFDSWGGWGLWGWGPSWFGHSIYVNNVFFRHYGFHHDWHGGRWGRSTWVHDPGHRMHIPYQNPQVAARFGGRAMGPRDSFRGGSGMRGGSQSYAANPVNRYSGRGGESAYRGTQIQTPHTQNPTRQSYQGAQSYGGSGLRGGSSSYAVNPAGRYSGRGGDSAYRGAQVQPPRTQNPTRQSYQGVQSYRTAPEITRSQVQSPQAMRGDAQGYRESPRVVPFGGRTMESSRAPEQYRSAPQQYRPAPQVYTPAPQVQRYQSQPQMRFQSAPQMRAPAPQGYAPRSSGGGGFSRGGGEAGFNRGGGGGSSRGGGNSSRSGGGGGNSRHR